MKFEWDDDKNKTNLEKHGIDFETATEAFRDPNAVYRFDRIIDEEKRFHVVGKVRGMLIFWWHLLNEMEISG